MSASPETQSPAGCNSHVVYKMSSGESCVVLLRTISVRIINPNSGRSILAYAQLDSASQATLISESLCAELGLEQHNNLNTFSRGVESRTQSSRPRPQKKSETKDSPSEDRPSRGQGQKCSRPRPRIKETNASVLQKKVFKKTFHAISKKKNLQKYFLGNPKKKKTVYKNFSADLQNFNHSKNNAVLEPRTRQFSKT